MQEKDSKSSDIKRILYAVIFGYDSKAGKVFDVVLIILILSSVVAVMLESVASFKAQHNNLFYVLEWTFTVVFTIEYFLRLYCSPSRKAYALSFYGVVDLLSVLPTYISFFIPGAASLIVIRILRVLRIFRILKLMRYVGEANLLIRAMKQSRFKILLFFYCVLAVMVIFGSIMFLVEGPENGFTSIPTSIYWAIVTITTVGYGDITPITPVGQTIAVMAMITGYAIIAVPTGIIGSELMNEYHKETQAKDIKDMRRVCTNCNKQGHDADAEFCTRCGANLPGNVG